MCNIKISHSNKIDGMRAPFVCVKKKRNKRKQTTDHVIMNLHVCMCMRMYVINKSNLLMILVYVQSVNMYY